MQCMDERLGAIGRLSIAPSLPVATRKIRFGYLPTSKRRKTSRLAEVPLPV